MYVPFLHHNFMCTNHSSRLDASFLRALMENKRNGGRTAPGSRAGTRQSSPVPNGVTGMKAFLKSRANSVAPEGDEANSLENAAAFPMEDFWSNMLMP